MLWFINDHTVADQNSPAVAGRVSTAAFATQLGTMQSKIATVVRALEVSHGTAFSAHVHMPLLHVACKPQPSNQRFCQLQTVIKTITVSTIPDYA